MREGRISVNHAKVAICGATLVVAERPWEHSKAELEPVRGGVRRLFVQAAGPVQL